MTTDEFALTLLFLYTFSVAAAIIGGFIVAAKRTRKRVEHRVSDEDLFLLPGAIDTESEIITRVIKLPERVTREVRHAPAEAQPKVVDAANKQKRLIWREGESPYD